MIGILVNAYYTGTNGYSGYVAPSQSEHNESSVSKVNIKPFMGCGIAIKASNTVQMTLGMLGMSAFGEQSGRADNTQKYPAYFTLSSFSGKVGVQVALANKQHTPAKSAL
jgi:hypothetical protein